MLRDSEIYDSLIRACLTADVGTAVRQLITLLVLRTIDRMDNCLQVSESMASWQGIEGGYCILPFPLKFLVVGKLSKKYCYCQKILFKNAKFSSENAVLCRKFATFCPNSVDNLQCLSTFTFTWVTEGGDLDTADWGCLAGHCASLCLQAAHGSRVAGGSG